MQVEKIKPSTNGAGLFRRRECLVPTFRGWIVLGCLGTVLIVLVGRNICTMLTVNEPVPGGVLVVEGWAADYVMQAAITEFQHGHYSKLFVTGGPLEKGAPLSEYKTFAELGAATLIHLGLDTNAVQAIPTPNVRQDRTYASAVALKSWLGQPGLVEANITVISVGPHSRRTRLLFERALGLGYRVGMIAIANQNFDPAHWWQSSAGVRTVIDEAIAYLYARLLFRPGE